MLASFPCSFKKGSQLALPALTSPLGPTLEAERGALFCKETCILGWGAMGKRREKEVCETSSHDRIHIASSLAERPARSVRFFESDSRICWMPAAAFCGLLQGKFFSSVSDQVRHGVGVTDSPIYDICGSFKDNSATPQTTNITAAAASGEPGGLGCVHKHYPTTFIHLYLSSIAQTQVINALYRRDIDTQAHTQISISTKYLAASLHCRASVFSLSPLPPINQRIKKGPQPARTFRA